MGTTRYHFINSSTTHRSLTPTARLLLAEPPLGMSCILADTLFTTTPGGVGHPCDRQVVVLVGESPISANFPDMWGSPWQAWVTNLVSHIERQSRSF